jgi:hypothetical protein
MILAFGLGLAAVTAGCSHTHGDCGCEGPPQPSGWNHSAAAPTLTPVPEGAAMPAGPAVRPEPIREMPKPVDK